MCSKESSAGAFVLSVYVLSGISTAGAGARIMFSSGVPNASVSIRCGEESEPNCVMPKAGFATTCVGIPAACLLDAGRLRGRRLALRKDRKRFLWDLCRVACAVAGLV